MAPERKDASDRIRHDLLYRLRWNFLTALDRIEIVTGSPHEEIAVPLLGHSSADELLISPPLSRLKIAIGELGDKRLHDRCPDPFRYQPPASLVIGDGLDEGITLKEFVVQTHTYVNQNIEEVKKVKGETYPSEKRTEINGQPYLPPNIGLFYKRVWAAATGDEIGISVTLFAEGQFPIPLDQFWTEQMNHAHMHEQERQGSQPAM